MYKIKFVHSIPTREQFEDIIQQILLDKDYQKEFNKNVGNSIFDECHIGLLEYLDGYSHY